MKKLLILFFTIHLSAQSFINILDTKEIDLKSVNELSALAYDGKILYALSNLSVLHHFKIDLQKDKIDSLKLIKTVKLKNKKDKDLKKKKSDSEGMVFVDGELYTSFERKPRVNIYSLNGKKIKKYKIPKFLRDIQNYQGKNKALESITYNEKYGILLSPEKPLLNEDKNYHTIYSKKDSYKFKYTAKLTALEFINENELLSIEREFSYFNFQRVITLSKIYLNRCNDNICKSEVLAVFNSNSEINAENFEGLTKVGKNKFLMVSDDNDSIFQKTLLVLFEIKEN